MFSTKFKSEDERRAIHSVKGHNRIVVKRDGEEWIVPSWISEKGNLCWKIGEILYVKRLDGKTSMLQNGKWVPSNAETKAKAPEPTVKRPEEPVKRMEFPDTL